MAQQVNLDQEDLLVQLANLDLLVHKVCQENEVEMDNQGRAELRERLVLQVHKDPQAYLVQEGQMVKEDNLDWQDNKVKGDHLDNQDYLDCLG